MGQEDGEDVITLMELVFVVHGDDDGVGGPADYEDHEDDEQGAGQAYGFFALFLLLGNSRPVRLLGVGYRILDGGDLILVFLEEDVDFEVTDWDEDDRESDTSDGEEHGVGQISGSIPDAAQSLTVENVVSPTNEVRHLHEEADNPETYHHAYAVPYGVHSGVHSVVADVDVAIETYCSDTQQGTEAAG